MLHKGNTLCSLKQMLLAGVTFPSSTIRQRAGRCKILALHVHSSLAVWFSEAAVKVWCTEAHISERPAKVLGPGDHNHPDASDRLPLGVAPNSEPDRLQFAIARLRFHGTRPIGLSRWLEALEVARPRCGGEPVHLIVGSTGLQPLRPSV